MIVKAEICTIRRSDCLLLPEHGYLLLRPPGIAAGGPVGANNAMAGHANIHAAVSIQYITYRAASVRVARPPGHFLVREGLAFGYSGHCGEDLCRK